MKKKLRSFFGSLTFRLIILISLIGILPAVILQTSLLKTYERRAVNVKTIEILNQAKILANTVVSEGYLDNPSSALIDAELLQLTNIYAARAIMTTDTMPKEAAVRFEIGGNTVTLGGMCKGSILRLYGSFLQQVF